MSNVFLLYIPPGNEEAKVHYQDTIKNRVPLSRISPHISANLRARLISIFGARSMAVWGSQAGPGNRSKFDAMSEGDDVLIVEGQSIRLMGKIAAKVESKNLSRELWKPLRGEGSTSWELIYFIGSARELDVPFVEFCKLFGYSANYQLRGFTAVAETKLEDFHASYGDLYSVLERVQAGQSIVDKRSVIDAELPEAPSELVEVSPDEIQEVLTNPIISDHVRMQWKLARLGLKAGERVWIPVNDQARLRKAYEFSDFDQQFAAGIDLPHSYIENIDVIWKQEFRIGAAYEIENSTAIYSGLLRFADLTIVAPNSNYPMLIVAPQNRKGRVRDQVRRPAFQRLGLDRKVRFLPYEAVDEIDEFFAKSSTGLNVDVVLGKAEELL